MYMKFLNYKAEIILNSQLFVVPLHVFFEHLNFVVNY